MEHVDEPSTPRNEGASNPATPRRWLLAASIPSTTKVHPEPRPELGDLPTLESHAADGEVPAEAAQSKAQRHVTYTQGDEATVPEAEQSLAPLERNKSSLHTLVESSLRSVSNMFSDDAKVVDKWHRRASGSGYV